MNEIVPVSPTPLVPADMDQAIRLAKAMSTAKMLPKHLWDDVGTCLMVVEQAMRWNMSPFAVAQCSSSIGGKMMYEGKLLAAAAESTGAIEGHFDYEFAGEGDERQVTISARRKGDVNPRQMTIRLKDVRTTNEHWKKQPDQMLVYSGARNWTRRFTPSVLLGSYAPEEFNRDGKPAAEEFTGQTIDAESSERDAINAAVPLRAAAAPTPRAERVVDPTVYDTPSPQPQKLSWSQWGDSLEVTARETPDDALGRVLARAEVGEIKRLAEQGAYSPAKARILEAIREMEERYNAHVKPPAEDADADTDSAAEPAHA